MRAFLCLNNCCPSENDRRRSRPLQYRRNDLDNDHWSATFETRPHSRNRTTGGRHFDRGCLRSRAEQSKTEGQKSRASAIRKKAEVSDADETFGKQVKQKPAQKLVDRHRH